MFYDLSKNLLLQNKHYESLSFMYPDQGRCVGRSWEACNVIAFLPPESECNNVFCDNIIQGLKSCVSCPAPAEQVH